MSIWWRIAAIWAVVGLGFGVPPLINYLRLRKGSGP